MVNLADGCAAAARAAGVPTAGTATEAKWWLLVEHSGPWPATAVADALDDLVPPAERAAVDAFQADGGRVLLIRGSGRRRRGSGPRNIYLAVSEPGRERVWHGRRHHAAGLSGIDLDAVRSGRQPADMSEYAGPMFLVCTHGGRDMCCALAGRPIAAELAVAHPDRMWECSHVGGNQFAGNLVTLPHGYLHGGLEPDQAGRVVAELLAGRVPLEHLRGRSVWNGWGQHAEIAVRRRLAESGHPAAAELEAVLVRQVLSGDVTAHAVVTVAGSARRWLVSLWRTPPVCARESRCGPVASVAGVRSQVIAGDPVGGAVHPRVVRPAA